MNPSSQPLCAERVSPPRQSRMSAASTDSRSVAHPRSSNRTCGLRIRLSDRFHRQAQGTAAKARSTPRGPKMAASPGRRVPRVGTFCLRLRKWRSTARYARGRCHSGSSSTNPAEAVPSVSHFGPGPRVAGYQDIMHFLPQARPALPRRAGSHILSAILPIAMRPERVSRPAELPGRPGELHPEPPTDPDVNRWDRAPARLR